MVLGFFGRDRFQAPSPDRAPEIAKLSQFVESNEAAFMSAEPLKLSREEGPIKLPAGTQLRRREDPTTSDPSPRSFIYKKLSSEVSAELLPEGYGTLGALPIKNAMVPNEPGTPTTRTVRVEFADKYGTQNYEILAQN